MKEISGKNEISNNYYSIKHELQLDCLVGVTNVSSKQFSTTNNGVLGDLYRVDGIVPLSKFGYRQNVYVQNHHKHQQQHPDSGLSASSSETIPHEALHLDFLIGAKDVTNDNGMDSDTNHSDESRCDLSGPSTDSILQTVNHQQLNNSVTDIANELISLSSNDMNDDCRGKSCANQNIETSLPLLTIQSKSISSIITNKKNHQKFIEKHKELMVTTIGNDVEWLELRKELRRSDLTTTVAIQQFLAKKSILRVISDQVAQESQAEIEEVVCDQEGMKIGRIRENEVVKVLIDKPMKDLQEDFKRESVSAVISSLLSEKRPSFRSLRRSFKWDEMPSVTELFDDASSVLSDNNNDQIIKNNTNKTNNRESLELGSRIWKSEPSVNDDSMSNKNIYSTTKKFSSLPSRCKEEELFNRSNSNVSNALSDALKISSLANFDFDSDTDDSD